MQPAPGHESSRRRLLGFSVGLNVLCVFLLVLVIHRSGKVADPAPVPGVKPPEAVAPPMRTPLPIRERRDAQTVPSEPTPWSRLVSADLREYARNLSQAGCPAETLCDILMPESKRAVEARRVAGEVSTNFWLTGKLRAAQHRVLEAEIAQRKQDRGDLLAELDCREFNDHEDEALGDIISRLLAGFLSPERRKVLMGIFLELEPFDDRWKERTHGVVMPSDLQALEDEDARLAARLGSVVTSAEFEEICLRTAAFVRSIKDDGLNEKGLAAIRVTPTELRELFRRAYAAGENIAEHATHSELRILGEDPPKRPDDVREADFREVLGADRAAELHLRSSPSYVISREWVEKYGTDPETPRRIQSGLDQFQQEIAALAANGRDQPETVREEFRTAFASALEHLEQDLDRVTATNRTKLLRGLLMQAAQNGWRSP